MRSLRLMRIGPALLRLTIFAVETSLALVLLVLVPAAPKAFAQNNHQNEEKTFADGYTPLVYDRENTGAYFHAPDFPSFAQLPIIRPLPDPFQSREGWRDTSFEGWERKRNEIKAAVEKYEIGPKPDCHDCTITSTYTPPAAGSTNGTLTVVVTRKGKSLTLTSGIYIPQGMGSGPFPALIPMEIASFSFGSFVFNFPPPTPPDYASLPPAVFQNLPIATVGYVSTQVAQYAFESPSDHTTDPFYQLYPEYCEGICTGTSNQGEYAVWSWGVSRLIDGMEIATHQSPNPLPIDMKHLAVSGCSFAGKMALLAGALDERIALTIAQESGGGGATSWRVSHDIEADGTVEDVDDTNYDWWAGQMYQFNGANVYKMPVDQHELMAMVAPRALLETGNTEYYWLSNGSNYVASRATQKIYNTLGIGDRFGFYLDGNHGHCATLPAESAPIQAFVNKFMLGERADTDVEVYPNPADTTDYGYPIMVGSGGYAYYFPTMDYDRWTDWWGSNKPEFRDDWNTGGTVLASLHGDLEVNSGDTIEGGYELMLGGDHPAATVSLVSGANISTDISCVDGSSYTLTIPLPAQSYSLAAGDNAWNPAADPNSPLNYEGSATATAPTGYPACVSGRVTHAYFSANGLSENGDGNPGGPGFTTTDITDPLTVKLHILDSTTGKHAGHGPPVTVVWTPLTSADSTNQNPMQ
jgi:hypothetical protein